MIKITVETNADDFARAIEQDLAGFSRMMHQAMNDALNLLSQETRYPPPAPVPSYTRTFKLQDSLTPGGSQNIKEVKNISGGAIGRFGSRLSYAPYVIDDKMQAWMHQGRWWTLQGKAQRSIPKLDSFFEVRVNEYVKEMLESE